MRLELQIYSILYSSSFGIIFYFLLDLFNKYTNKIKYILKIIISLFFVFCFSLIYFIGLLYINNGYLHFYFLVSILVGYLFAYFLKNWFTFKNK